MHHDSEEGCRNCTQDLSLQFADRRMFCYAVDLCQQAIQYLGKNSHQTLSCQQFVFNMETLIINEISLQVFDHRKYHDGLVLFLKEWVRVMKDSRSIVDVVGQGALAEVNVVIDTAAALPSYRRLISSLSG